MRFFALIALAAVAVASPVSELEKEIKDNGVNVDKLHDIIEKMNEDVLAKIDATADKKEIADFEAEQKAHRITGPPPMAEDKEGPLDMNELNAAAGLEKDLFEGDLMLTKEQMEIVSQADASGSRSRRQALKNAGFSWGTNANIPYAFSAGYPSDRFLPIQTAMRFWADNTCLNFTRYAPTSAPANHVIVKDSAGCSSYVGKINGAQNLNLGAGCMSIGTIAHELSHTLGIFHVQSRYDRNNYVTIDQSAIQSGFAHNFNLEGQDKTNLYNIPYEFGSNMHYGESDFAVVRGKAVLKAKAGYEAYQHGMMGRLPTFFDIDLVNQHYACYNNCPTKPTCMNGGVVNVRKCSECKCPIGFTGATCATKITATELTATTTQQTLPINMGTAGATAGLTYTNKYYRITAPVGKTIKIVPVYKGTSWTNSCSTMGVQVQIKKDPRFTGVQVCNWSIDYSLEPLKSESNVVLIQAYTLGGQMAADIKYSIN